MIEPYTGKVMYKLEDDFGLFEAMRGAGSSFGIVTEFLYKIYPRPETQPIVAMIYLEDSYDLRKLEKASKDGRYHLTWFVPYIFRPITFAIELLVLDFLLEFLMSCQSDLVPASHLWHQTDTKDPETDFVQECRAYPGATCGQLSICWIVH